MPYPESTNHTLNHSQPKILSMNIGRIFYYLLNQKLTNRKPPQGGIFHQLRAIQSDFVGFSARPPDAVGLSALTVRCGQPQDNPPAPAC